MVELASLDPDFTLIEWDRLIPQAELTLNLLRSARSNLKLSAWECLFGQFNYMATLVVLPRIKVLARDKPGSRPHVGNTRIRRMDHWDLAGALQVH